MKDHSSFQEKRKFRIFCTAKEQLAALSQVPKEFQRQVDRIYLDADCALENKSEILILCEKLHSVNSSVHFFLSLPQILREKDQDYLEQIYAFQRQNPILEGILTGSLEGLGFFLEQGEREGRDVTLIGDHNLYAWNHEACLAWENVLQGACLPLELTKAESKKLISQGKIESGAFWDKLIYGYVPLMVTANCVAKTAGKCHASQREKEREVTWLKDRKGISFPVRTNCRHCFNMIYNSVPLSLHGSIKEWGELGVGLRLQFTMESAKETEAILKWFWEGAEQEVGRPFRDYTTGHEKRGVL